MLSAEKKKMKKTSFLNLLILCKLKSWEKSMTVESWNSSVIYKRVSIISQEQTIDL